MEYNGTVTSIYRTAGIAGASRRMVSIQIEKDEGALYTQKFDIHDEYGRFQFDDKVLVTIEKIEG